MQHTFAVALSKATVALLLLLLLLLLLILLATGVPQKSVLFRTPTGNISVLTDEQGYAKHVVTAAAAGPLSVTAEYFNSRTFETTVLPLEVEVEQVGWLAAGAAAVVAHMCVSHRQCLVPAVHHVTLPS
jgi:hypothetical protein